MNSTDTIYCPWQHCHHQDCSCSAHPISLHQGQKWLLVYDALEYAQEDVPDACEAEELTFDEAMIEAEVLHCDGLAVVCDHRTEYYRNRGVRS